MPKHFLYPSPVANVPAIGETDDLAGADVAALRAEVEDRLDVIEAKIDELIAALIAAGLMRE